MKQALVASGCVSTREPWHLLVKLPPKGLTCHHLSCERAALLQGQSHWPPTWPAANVSTRLAKQNPSSAKWKAVHVEVWYKPKNKQVTLKGITGTITTERHSKRCWLGQWQLWIGRKSTTQGGYVMTTTRPFQRLQSYSIIKSHFDHSCFVKGNRPQIKRINLRAKENFFPYSMENNTNISIKEHYRKSCHRREIWGCLRISHPGDIKTVMPLHQNRSIFDAVL